MSEGAQARGEGTQARGRDAPSRLPPWLAPLDAERRGSGSLRLAETTVVILFGVLLAIASVNDLVLQTHVNNRLRVDLRSWRAVTGHDYRNLTIEQDAKGHTTRDVVCGNVSPGAPGERTQICLVFTGPAIGGKRAVNGGYYLPPKLVDTARSRYACFGAAVSGELCGR